MFWLFKASHINDPKTLPALISSGKVWIRLVTWGRKVQRNASLP